MMMRYKFRRQPYISCKLSRRAIKTPNVTVDLLLGISYCLVLGVVCWFWWCRSSGGGWGDVVVGRGGVVHVSKIWLILT